MAFRGWPAEALEFYEGLEADNSRTYWTEHKAVYERQVREPMLALLEDLRDEFGAGKVFRPHRDVRFSADKSPYKPWIGATLEHGGYVQLSANGLACGTGMYAMSPDQLARFRQAVADERTGSAVVALADAAKRRGDEITAMDRLKSAPKGYPRDHPRIELLRLKGLIAWHEWPVEPWLGTARAKTRLVTFLRAARPLTAWLDEHVGPANPS